jgi:DNA-directed RNA polymerase sigma subunit (sigma70/sigma32)
MRIEVDADRDKRIIELREAGSTFELIGKVVGVSRQRAQQLYVLAQKRQNRQRNPASVLIALWDRLFRR